MDKDDSLTIDWEEWRDHLHLNPHSEVEDILLYWRSSLVGQRGLGGGVFISEPSLGNRYITVLGSSLVGQGGEGVGYLYLYPHSEIKDILLYWRSSLVGQVREGWGIYI